MKHLGSAIVCVIIGTILNVTAPAAEALKLEALKLEASPAVATINGQPLTLRDIEDALLRKEGGDLIEGWVHDHLQKIDYATLKDDDIILSIGFNKIGRRELADALLRKGAGETRKDLINIRLVEQAIAAAGITVGADEIEATWQRMKRTFEQQQAKAGEGTRIDFINYLNVKEKMTPEVFRAQPGFKMLAGLQALIHFQAKDEWKDEELRAWFAVHRERYRQREAVRLSLIAIPYQAQPGAGGMPEITAGERERLMKVMDALARQISSKQMSFSQVWALYARSYDPDVGPGGHTGWVDRDGKRKDPQARVLGADLVAAAWAVKTFPAMLPPLAAGDWGVELALVEAHRPEKEPVYEDLRQTIKDDRIDETLELRTAALLERLRHEAKIDYASLPDIINGKR
jgi:hypothetical protein